ncbi:MAG: thioester reductase domain-containing protein [Gemmataceae bacterium]|nr:thioester reductase domain-containing protein [Gemmataceae bacterium]
MADLVTQLQRCADADPERTLYNFLGRDGRILESYTRRRFVERSASLAAQLSDTNQVRRGEPVLLAYPPGLEVLAAFFACARIGAIPVPVPAPEGSAAFVGGIERLAHIQRDSGAAVVLTNAATLERVAARTKPEDPAGSSAAALLAGTHWIATDSLPTEIREFDPCPHPILFLQYTSGSTHQPRGVIVTHDNVLHNCHGTIDRDMIGVCWLPHYHDMGLIGALLFAAVSGGAVYAFAPVDFLRQPLLWLQAISTYGASITPAPNFGYDYCLRADRIPDSALDTLDLRSMRCMINGSEPVRSRTMTSFYERFRRCGLARSALVAAYGLAENTLTVSMQGRIALDLDRRLLQRNQVRIDRTVRGSQHHLSLPSSGRPMAGVEVRIVDPETRRDLGEDAIGEIWVAGPSKTAGYWRKPELTHATFAARLAGDAARGDAIGVDYLRTGDLGFLHDGEVFVCGRLKDTIIVRGKNFYPQDIEAAVEQFCPDSRPASTVAFAVADEAGADHAGADHAGANHAGAESAVVLIEVRPRGPLPDLDLLAREIHARTFLEAPVIALVRTGSLARTSSGKIARGECKRRWQAGEMDVLQVRRHDPDATSEQVLSYLLDDVELAGAADLTLAEVGVDSLTIVNLSLDIQKLLKARGYNGAADLYDLRALQAFKLGEIRRWIQEAIRQGDRWQPDPTLLTDRLRALGREEEAQMRLDAVLPADIRPRSEAPSPTGTVLLTGATGFFGAFLLEALLRLSTNRIAVLVRSQDPEHARGRVQAALRRTGCWDAALEQTVAERVTPILGDLAQPRLGLADGVWGQLARELSSICHCGATVDYVKPYQSLRQANVQAVADLLRLACEDAPKTFHLVSTTFIFGWSGPVRLLETDGNSAMQGLDFGYIQTKWVAEQLVLEAARRGVPVKIYRPSLITAARNGRYSRSDILARTLGYMIRHQIGIGCRNQVSLLPADVTANNLIALALAPASDAAAYHLTADAYYSLPDVTAIITRDFGYPFRYVSLAEFVGHMNAHCHEGDPLFPLRPFFNKNHTKIEHMQDKRYDSERYRRARNACLPCWPEPPLEETVRAIVQYLQREGLVPNRTVEAVR